MQRTLDILYLWMSISCICFKLASLKYFQMEFQVQTQCQGFIFCRRAMSEGWTKRAGKETRSVSESFSGFNISRSPSSDGLKGWQLGDSVLCSFWREFGAPHEWTGCNKSTVLSVLSPQMTCTCAREQLFRNHQEKADPLGLWGNYLESICSSISACSLSLSFPTIGKGCPILLMRRA